MPDHLRASSVRAFGNGAVQVPAIDASTREAMQSDQPKFWLDQFLLLELLAHPSFLGVVTSSCTPWSCWFLGSVPERGPREIDAGDVEDEVSATFFEGSAKVPNRVRAVG